MMETMKLKKITISIKMMIMIKLKKIIIMMMKINSLMANMITLMKMIKVIRMKMMIVKGLRWNNDHQFLLCFLRKFMFWRGLSKGLANVSFLTCFLQKDFCNDFVNILDSFSFFFFFFFHVSLLLFLYYHLNDIDFLNTLDFLNSFLILFYVLLFSLLFV